MAITSEIIGKLSGGGADVGVVPVSVPGIKGGNTTQVMHTVNIPSGETWLVTVVGTGTAGSITGSNMPHIIIGGMIVRQDTGHFASAAVMTESGDVIFKSNSSSESSFEGNIYTVKM